MLKVLVLIDGSEHSNRVAQFLVKQNENCRSQLDIHLLNVQHPLPGTIVGVAEQAKKFHNEEGNAALSGARKILDQAGVKYSSHISVGEIANAVEQSVAEFHCDHVVMGTRGMGSVRNMLLGSVATKVLHIVHVPVTLIK